WSTRCAVASSSWAQAASTYALVNLNPISGQSPTVDRVGYAPKAVEFGFKGPGWVVKGLFAKAGNDRVHGALIPEPVTVRQGQGTAGRTPQTGRDSPQFSPRPARQERQDGLGRVPGPGQRWIEIISEVGNIRVLATGTGYPAPGPSVRSSRT